MLDFRRVTNQMLSINIIRKELFKKKVIQSIIFQPLILQAVKVN